MPRAIVAELAVESLVVAVLPWFPRIDVRGVDARVGRPFEDRIDMAEARSGSC